MVTAGDKSRTVVAFIPMIRRMTKDDTLSDLTSTDEITTRLLTSDPFTMTYTPRTSSTLSTDHSEQMATCLLILFTSHSHNCDSFPRGFLAYPMYALVYIFMYTAEGGLSYEVIMSME